MSLDHSVSDSHLAFDFPEFIHLLGRKLRLGADEYGDDSFSRSGPELLQEIKAEVVDICGWSFVLFCRLRDLEQKLKEVDGNIKNTAVLQLPRKTPWSSWSRLMGFFRK